MSEYMNVSNPPKEFLHYNKNKGISKGFTIG